MRIVIWLLPSVVIVAACGSSSPELDWSHYDHNCGADSDCIPIGTASGCECPLCDNHAINQADEQTYEADLKAYQAACKGTACSNIACPVVTARCDNGTCQIQ